MPATPPAEVRLGAPAVLPPGIPAHAGVVTTGAGDGAAGWTGAGAGPEGFGWTAAPLEPAAAEVAPLDGDGAGAGAADALDDDDGRGVAVAAEPLAVDGAVEDALDDDALAAAAAAAVAEGDGDGDEADQLDDDVACWRSSANAEDPLVESSTIVIVEALDPSSAATSLTAALPPTSGAMRMALATSAVHVKSDRNMAVSPRKLSGVTTAPRPSCSTVRLRAESLNRRWSENERITPGLGATIDESPPDRGY